VGDVPLHGLHAHTQRNREIAVELGVSVKSVEWHVSHILRKLAITSRTELADALAQPRQPR